MNLHSVQFKNEHIITGILQENPRYRCTCGWQSNRALSQHAFEAGIIDTPEGSLYYCNSRTRQICNRIIGRAGANCGDHRL